MENLDGTVIAADIRSKANSEGDSRSSSAAFLSVTSKKTAFLLSDFLEASEMPTFPPPTGR